MAFTGGCAGSGNGEPFYHAPAGCAISRCPPVDADAGRARLGRPPNQARARGAAINRLHIAGFPSYSPPRGGFGQLTLQPSRRRGPMTVIRLVATVLPI